MVRLIPAGTPAATVKALLTPDGNDAARADGLRVNAAAEDLKRRTDDFARRLYGGK